MAHSGHSQLWAQSLVLQLSRPGGGLFDERPMTPKESGAFSFVGKNFRQPQRAYARLPVIPCRAACKELTLVFTTRSALL
jgi:hypothetical protein